MKALPRAFFAVKNHANVNSVTREHELVRSGTFNNLA